MGNSLHLFPSLWLGNRYGGSASIGGGGISAIILKTSDSYPKDKNQRF